MTMEETKEENEEIETLLPNTNIVTHCVLKNDVGRLIKCFENDDDPFNESVNELIHLRSDDGKCPIDIAATLGRTEMMRELLQRGVDVNGINGKGFCALHHAAAWGQVKILKILVEAQANLQQTNSHGERGREVAQRYNQTECVDYLDWAEAKVTLMSVIKSMQETIADPEKVLGRLNKDDKNVALNACKEKFDWVESTPEATTQDFIVQKQILEEALAPVNQKLSEPLPEKPEKK